MSSHSGKPTAAEHGALQTGEPVSSEPSSPLVQYILVRTDLNWGTGALIAQACHASVASIANTFSNPHTANYLRDLDNMHKVILQATKEQDLLKVAGYLKEANIDHHLWIEKPENVISCLAVSPQPKHSIVGFFRHFKLLR